MKKIILIIIAGLALNSCAENPKKGQHSESDIEINSETTEDEIKLSSEDLEVSMEQLGGLLSTGEEAEGEKNELPEVDALKKMLEMSGMEDQDTAESFQDLLTKDISSSDMLSTAAFLDMLEASGVSRTDMEKLLNNPDSLAILAAAAVKKREASQKEAPLYKGKISTAQLSTKNPSTGVSLEEAILLVQAESGPEATMQKLKQIDSLAGTNVMQQMDLTEAGYLMTDVARKNETPATAEEEKLMKALRDRSGQLHSEKEANQLLADLEKAEKDLASGKRKASPRFQRTIAHQKKTVAFYQKDIARKSATAKKKFQELNPDLYFGEEVGETYFGGPHKTAVYLPLGDLSFADKVVKANHPKLLTQEVANVIGEPDVIETFDDATGIYSLGLGGELIIQFVNNALTDVNGPDLYIFEIGQLEPTELDISKDGKNWVSVGKIDGGVAQVDIAPYVKQGELFYYVRLKDLKMESGLPGADVDAIAAIGAAMRLNLDSKVLFATGKSELKAAGIAALKELAESISVLKRGNVIVEGHTDDVGSDETNQRLSLARAKSVSTELKKLIPSNTFKWKEKGLGESNPLVKNDSDQNRAKNRRVEVLVLPN